MLELASVAREPVLHNDCEVADEQGGRREQLSNNNKIHNQFLYMFQARAVLRIAPEAMMIHLTVLMRKSAL